MAPANSHRNLEDDFRDAEMELALLQRDLEYIKGELGDIKGEVKTIKSYFNKAVIGAAGLVGLYFLQWMLTGGLFHVISATTNLPGS